MHYHVWGSYHAKFDDDDFNTFQGIACEGHTYDTHTHTQRLGGGGGRSSTLTFAKSLTTLQTKRIVRIRTGPCKTRNQHMIIATSEASITKFLYIYSGAHHLERSSDRPEPKEPLTSNGGTGPAAATWAVSRSYSCNKHVHFKFFLSRSIFRGSVTHHYEICSSICQR